MAKIPADLSATDSTDARQSLLREAARLFAEQGYSATGVQEITDAAGVNKAMLYYYFHSKERLFDALITEGITAVEAAVAAAEDDALSLRARLTGFLHAYLTVVERQPDLGRIIYREVVGAGERARQTVADHLSESIRRIAAVLAGAQARGELRAVDPVSAAYSLFGMATMFIASYFVTGRPLDIEVRVAQIVDLFLHGVGEPTC